MSYQYRTVGGIPPITFAVTAGALPAGLAMSSGGLITGTTTTAEHDNAWTVTATDAEGNTATLADIAYVLDMLGDPPDVMGGDAYSYALTGTEGTAPYTFALTTGSLPPGLSLATGGTISGTAGLTAATYPFTVTMTDAAGVDTVKPYDIAVKSVTAAALLLNIEHWWAFDGDLTDDEPVLPESMGAYADLPSYQTGIRGQEAKALSRLGANLNYSTISSDASFWFWINPVGVSNTNRTQVMLAEIPNNPTHRLGVSIYDSGTSLRLHVDDSDDADLPTVTATIAPGIRAFALVNINWSAKTVSFYVNDLLAGTSTAVSNFWADMQSMVVRPNTGDEAADAVDYVGQLGFMRRIATSDERTYLYNTGVGKSYADLVTDGTV